MAYKNNKKGQIAQGILLLVVLVVVAVIALMGYKAFSDLNTDIQSDADVNPIAKNESQQSFDQFSPTMDGAFGLAMALLWVLLIVSAYYADTAPIYMILLVIVIVALVVVAGLLSNSWDEFTDDPEINFELVFPITNWVLDNYLVVFLVMGLSSVGVLYWKNR